MPAYYSATAAFFLSTPPESVLGTLISQAERAGFAQHKHTQTAAWRTSIHIVSEALREVIAADPAASDWGVLFEFPIPRRSKRADVVILTGSRIFVLEFKVGQTHFDQASQRQAIDYCLDLRDFHEPSRKRLLIPVVIATAATESERNDLHVRDFVAEPVLASRLDLPRILRSGSTSSIAERIPLAIDQWNEGKYRPTPTIIEAAQTLYAGHDVAEIAHSHAGASNLSTTRDAILDALHSAHSTNRKIICFVTGVPGSGKTLAGLNIAHNPNLKSEGHPLAVFLSGNGPLVRVLREALAIDYSQRGGATLTEARRRVATFIQNVHEFIAEYAEKQPSATPPDHVIIFDEAQRAWDAEQSKRKFDRDHSESALMLDIMARKPDWAVIVALVGAGQEINNGEAGLAEWGRALADRADTWSVSTSPHVIGSDDGLFRVPPPRLSIEMNAALHLNVSLR